MSDQPKSPCDNGDGTFDHDWKVVDDYFGDPDVIGGTQNFSYLRCRTCGEEDHDADTADYRPDPLPDDVI